MTQDPEQTPPSDSDSPKASREGDFRANSDNPEEPAETPEAPHDKKRVALLNGACGQANRIRICGQVVDIPVTRNQKFDLWENLHNLPDSFRKQIRPIEDFTMMGVRRPRLQIEILDIAPDDLNDGEASAKQLAGASVLYTSGIIVARDDGFFSHALDFGSQTPPEAGRYVLRVVLRGIDSIRQSVSDLAYIGNTDSLILKTDVPIGYGRLRVLPEDFTGHVLTSDIDQTFLDTPLHSTQGLMETLFEKPGEKRPIFALPEFYRQAQKHAPLLFISASPHFFRRTLSSVFEHHDIEFAGLHLKYLLSTFDNIVKKFAETMLNLNDFLGQGVGASVERTLKFLGSSVMSLFDHVSYKLITLLENRLMMPSGAREILMGDNKESDFFIFSLYQALLLGEITGPDLENYLYRLNFLERESLTRDSAKRIVELVDANLKQHGKLNSVDEVWINLSRDEPGADRMRTLVADALPPTAGEKYIDDPRYIKPRAARGGAGFALNAYATELLDQAAVLDILRSGEGGAYQGDTVDRDRIVTFIREFQPEPDSAFSADELIAKYSGDS